jgi:hypothetical protein
MADSTRNGLVMILTEERPVKRLLQNSKFGLPPKSPEAPDPTFSFNVAKGQMEVAAGRALSADDWQAVVRNLIENKGSEAAILGIAEGALPIEGWDFVAGRAEAVGRPNLALRARGRQVEAWKKEAGAQTARADTAEAALETADAEIKRLRTENASLTAENAALQPLLKEREQRIAADKITVMEFLQDKGRFEKGKGVWAYKIDELLGNDPVRAKAALDALTADGVLCVLDDDEGVRVVSSDNKRYNPAPAAAAATAAQTPTAAPAAAETPTAGEPVHQTRSLGMRILHFVTTPLAWIGTPVLGLLRLPGQIGRAPRGNSAPDFAAAPAQAAAIPPEDQIPNLLADAPAPSPGTGRRYIRSGTTLGRVPTAAPKTYLGTDALEGGQTFAAAAEPPSAGERYPVYVRKPTPAATTNTGGGGDLDYLDIPAFLGRQKDTDSPTDDPAHVGAPA